MYNVMLWCVRLMFIPTIYLNSLMPFQSKSALSRRYDIARNNCMYLGVHVGEPHTEGKTVINDNIIEKVTDFKYLGIAYQNTKVT